MRKRTMLAMLSVLLLAGLAACGGGEDGQDQPVQEGDAAAPVEEPETSMAEVTITNDLEAWDIVEVLADPTDEPWGEDRLGGEILAPGESVTFEVEPGEYDISITDEDFDTYTRWAVEIGPAGYEWGITLDDLDMGMDMELDEPFVAETGEGTAPVTIVNGLDPWIIDYVWVDPSDAPWGEDRLDDDFLFPEDMIVVWVDPGTYDIRVEDEDGDTYTLWGVDVDETGYEWEVSLSDID